MLGDRHVVANAARVIWRKTWIGFHLPSLCPQRSTRRRGTARSAIMTNRLSISVVLPLIAALIRIRCRMWWTWAPITLTKALSRPIQSMWFSRANRCVCAPSPCRRLVPAALLKEAHPRSRMPVTALLRISERYSSRTNASATSPARYSRDDLTTRHSIVYRDIRSIRTTSRWKMMAIMATMRPGASFCQRCLPTRWTGRPASSARAQWSSLIGTL